MDFLIPFITLVFGIVIGFVCGVGFIIHIEMNVRDKEVNEKLNEIRSEMKRK